jgi:hypothetical protein
MGRKWNIFNCAGLTDICKVMVWPFLALILSLLLPLSLLAQDNGSQGPGPLDALRDAVVDTGVGRDHIPALFSPRYISVSNASLSMDDGEVVFVATFFPDGVRIYPQLIMVWHEVVNDFIDDSQPVAITYCPLTGSLAAYRANIDRTLLSFGVSGRLLNSNTVLYDYFSASSWSQITGQCFDGLFKGRHLTRLPMLWSTWGRARQLWPDGKVLSRSTGIRRSYGHDPYGSYANTNSYYDDLSVMYPLLNVDRRLHPKRRILGIEIDGIHAAVDKEEVRKVGANNFTVGVTPLVAVWDPALDTARVFLRNTGDRVLSFDWADGTLVDSDTRTEWNNSGEGTLGFHSGTRLRQVIAIDCMWFAWAAFYPRTLIFPGDNFQTLPPPPGGLW